MPDYIKSFPRLRKPGSGVAPFVSWPSLDEGVGADCATYAHKLGDLMTPEDRAVFVALAHGQTVEANGASYFQH